MNIRPEVWPTLSQLLDEYLDLAEEARPAWLASLSPVYDSVMAELNQLLDAHRLAAGSGFLSSLPTFTCAAPDPGGSPHDISEFAPGARFGPYRLLRELGRGGMSVVWLAEGVETAVQRQVALKIPFIASDARTLAERFNRERDLLALLTHSNIARLYDAGVTHSGQPYLVLEYVSGRPITDHCDLFQLGLRERIGLFLQVLRAVQHAHSNLIVHRDLKPSNVLVTAQGEVRLLDFGIAKLLTTDAEATELTRAGGRALTPSYASPEQLAGAGLGTATDVYSLGVLFSELLAGDRPYKLKHDSAVSLENAILNAEVIRPSDIARDEEKARRRGLSARRLAAKLKGDLDTIVLKALKKRPEDRYPTADAFAEDLDRFLAGAPVHAQPESRWYRSRKFMRRNRYALASLAAVVMALSVGLGLALREAQLARTQARKAEAVQDFLQDIFNANSLENPDPLKAQKTTARELLDIGVKKLDTALNDAPEAKLEVLTRLSFLYTTLGMKEEGVAIKRKRIELTRAVYGPNHHLMAEALNDLANGIGESKSVNELGSILAESERILDYNRDFTSIDRQYLHLAKARLYRDSDLAKSEEESRRAIRLARNLGRDGELAPGLLILSWALTGQRKYREAIPVLQEAVAIIEREQGDVRSKLPSIYTQLGVSYLGILDPQVAEQAFRKAVASALALFDAEHESVLQTRMRLGRFLCETDRPDEGFRLIREALDQAVRTKGADDSFHTAGVMLTYGRWLVTYGRVEDGLKLLERSNDIRIRGKRTATDAYREAREYQAVAETVLGDYRQAAEHLREAGSGPGATSARVRLFLATGDTDRARKALAEFGAPEPDPSLISMERILLTSEVELASGQFADAMRLAHDLRLRVEDGALQAYCHRIAARAALDEGSALLQMKRAAEALPVLERSVRLSGIYDRERSPDLAAANIEFARCLARMGQSARARTALAQAEAIQSRHAALGSHLRAPVLELRRTLQAKNSGS